MKFNWIYKFIIFLAIAPTVLTAAAPDEKQYDLAHEFKIQHRKNLEFVSLGLTDSLDYVIVNPQLKKDFQTSLPEAIRLLNAFNRKYNVSVYFNLTLSVAKDNDAVLNLANGALPTPTNLLQSSSIEQGVIVQITIKHVLDNFDQTTAVKQISLRYGSNLTNRSCNEYLSESFQSEAELNPSFSTDPNKALIAYVMASLQALEKCFDKNNSSDPFLSNFRYVQNIGNSETGIFRFDDSKKLPEINKPDGIASIFDYAGVLNGQSQLLTQIQASSIGGDPLSLKYYSTDDKTNINLLNDVNKILPGDDEILIWNHIDNKNGKAYTSFKLGRKIQTALGNAIINSVDFTDRLWKSFKEVVTDPTSIFSGDNALMKSTLAANPLVQQITIAYWTAKFLVSAMNWLTIPEEVYNPENKNYYPIMYALVLNQHRIPFAFLCGLLNGVSSEIKGVGELIEMLIGYFVDDKKHEEINTMFSTLLEVGIINSWTQNLEMKYSGNSYQVSHQVGKDVVAVGTIFIGGVGLATKAGKLTLIIKFVNPVRDAFRGFVTLGKFAKRIGTNAIRIATREIVITVEKAVNQLEPYVVKYFHKADDSPFANPENYLPDELSKVTKSNGYDLDWTAYYAENKFPIGQGKFYPIEETFDFADGLDNLKGKLFKVADDTPDGRLEFIGEEKVASAKIAHNGSDVAEITTSLINSGEDFLTLTKARKLPGEIAGTGKEIVGNWLRGSHKNAGVFPKSIADKMRGINFKNFDEFRRRFWKEVANDDVLSKEFTRDNLNRMDKGLAPQADPEQYVGKLKSYVLHHKTPINRGGSVYDVDNLYIVTPRYHKEILLPDYHYGYGY